MLMFGLIEIVAIFVLPPLLGHPVALALAALLAPLAFAALR